MRDGRTEDGHDGVLDELLDRAPVALELLAQPGVVGTDARPDVLRIGGLRSGREADEVAEEDGDDLALLAQGGGPSRAQRGGAETAELEAVRVFLPAGRTGHHAPSLGRQQQGKKALSPRQPAPLDLLRGATASVSVAANLGREIHMTKVTAATIAVVAGLALTMLAAPVAGESGNRVVASATGSGHMVRNGFTDVLVQRGSTRTGRAPVSCSCAAPSSASSCTSRSTASGSSGTGPT